jgi:hypothetical protein
MVAFCNINLLGWIRRFITCLFILPIVYVTQAQTVENINTRFDGEKIVITYDLIHSNTTEKFKVDLYSSHDNYSSPLTLVTGSVGENISPGRANRAVWDAKSSLPADFDGVIVIRIKISKMVVRSPLAFRPLAATVLKRGRSLAVQWTGGLPDEKISLQLLQRDVPVVGVANTIANSGGYTWKMPKSVKGKNYSLLLSSSAQPQEKAKSQTFIVKSRTPFIVKILPVMAIGGALMFLGGGGEGGGTGESQLPGPIRPGG